MEPEEKSARRVKSVIDTIWGNFLDYPKETNFFESTQGELDEFTKMR